MKISFLINSVSVASVRVMIKTHCVWWIKINFVRMFITFALKQLLKLVTISVPFVIILYTLFMLFISIFDLIIWNIFYLCVKLQIHNLVAEIYLSEYLEQRKMGFKSFYIFPDFWIKNIMKFDLLFFLNIKNFKSHKTN